jgi:hypothetical protein
MFGFLKKAFKAIKSVAKPLVPVGKFAALVIPGGGSVLAGVQVADTVVKAANGLSDHKVVKKGNVLVAVKITPAEQQARKVKAKGIIATTHALANRGKTPAIRKAAAKGLTLMAKRAAALRFTRRHFKLNPRGIIVKVA